ncbi:uncharacterized protein LOC118426093 [Branchiostoma floridae]|uniref:Uncharacterized protein LOC118426093 n=1 Tax=Branchiostoma floridae TaxID=7739 RepID=A0A9J7LZD7_BRAFL|nr:uncharacterized protein LOC118426093 [Branchiostoma floridae]
MADSEGYDSDATHCSDIEWPDKEFGPPLVSSTPIHDTEFSALFDAETCPPENSEDVNSSGDGEVFRSSSEESLLLFGGARARNAPAMEPEDWNTSRDMFESSSESSSEESLLLFGGARARNAPAKEPDDWDTSRDMFESSSESSSEGSEESVVLLGIPRAMNAPAKENTVSEDLNTIESADGIVEETQAAPLDLRIIQDSQPPQHPLPQNRTPATPSVTGTQDTPMDLRTIIPDTQYDDNSRKYTVTLA